MEQMDLEPDDWEVIMAKTLRERHEIPEKYTWNKESVFANDEDWETAFTTLQSELEKLHAYRGRLGEGGKTLASAFSLRDELFAAARRIHVYASFSAAVDSQDEIATAQNSRAQGLFAQLGAATAFIAPELLDIGLETLLEWVASETSLALYEHHLRDLFRKQAHIRSAEVEELLGILQEPFSAAAQTAALLTGADLQFAPAQDQAGNIHEVANSAMPTLLASEDRRLRREAWSNYADGFLSVQNALANNLAFAIKRDVFMMRARGHKSSLHSALSNANLPTAVFHNLIQVFRQNLPTWHRYWRALRKALGVERLQPYDLWAPLTTNEPTVSYEQAVEWISAGLAPLGEEYQRIMRRGCLEERWVDVYPNRNKRAGAFSSGGPGLYPFIMMGHDERLGGMSTLAHELGHSMHSHYTWKQQPLVYGNYSMFVAETASNFNQAMTRAHLFQAHADDKDFQLALIAEAMSNFHRYFFIMPTLARFELITHERAERGASLTAQDMNSLMTELLSEGYGGEMEMDGERSAITWAQFGHLYANFYVFQYSTGISAAHELANRVLNEGEAAAKAYLGFLSAGASGYPLDVLSDAGVDMRTPQAVETTFAVLTEMVTRLENLTANRA